MVSSTRVGHKRGGGIGWEAGREVEAGGREGGTVRRAEVGGWCMWALLERGIRV